MSEPIEITHDFLLENLIHEKNDLIKMLQKEIESLKAELEKERSVVDFYAEENSWDDCVFLKTEDTDSLNSGSYVGGKLARQRQRERNESE